MDEALVRTTLRIRSQAAGAAPASADGGCGSSQVDLITPLSVQPVRLRTSASCFRSSVCSLVTSSMSADAVCGAAKPPTTRRVGSKLMVYCRRPRVDALRAGSSVCAIPCVRIEPADTGQRRVVIHRTSSSIHAPSEAPRRFASRPVPEAIIRVRGTRCLAAGGPCLAQPMACVVASDHVLAVVPDTGPA